MLFVASPLKRTARHLRKERKFCTAHANNGTQIKKTKENLADRYTAVLAKSTYTDNYEALQHIRTMKRLTNNSMGGNACLVYFCVWCNFTCHFTSALVIVSEIVLL